MPPPRKRPTVKDVAARAGVGLMTVSYTFNRPERVAEGTRRRVLEAAEQLGYRRPDSTARALRSGRTGQLGVVVGEHLSYVFDDPQAAQFLAGVADVCVDEDLGMVLIPTRGDATDVDRVLSAAVDAHVLWTTVSDDPVLAALVSSGRPAAVQGGPEHPGITSVTADDRAAAAAVTGAALLPGSSPLVVSFPLDRDRAALLCAGRDLPHLPGGIPFPVTGARLAGYRDGLTAHGYDWDAVPVAVVERNQRHLGARAARALLTDLDDQTSLTVLAMSDELALGALSVLARPGRAVSVAGWDASQEGQAAGLVSVSASLREQGRLCARAALDPEGTPRDVPWTLTGPAPASGADA